MVIKKTQDLLPVIQKQVSPIVTQAQALTITTPEEMSHASEMRTTLKRAEKDLKEDKEKLTKPANILLKEIRSRYSPVEDIIETSLLLINKKMGAYQTEQDAIAEQERARIAARVLPGKGNLRPETAINKMAEVTAPATRLESTLGATEFMDVKKFEVISILDLPLSFHVADEVAIRAEMRKGFELPGVRYWTEKVPKSSR